MSDFLVSRPGQTNASGSATALFYQKFTGEVMTFFNENNIARAKTMLREIQSGKSAAFAATGNAVASYHVPGTEIDGQAVKHAERVINVDSLLVAPVFVANIDEAMAEYQVRGIYSKQCGEALALRMDQQILRVGVLAARAAATINTVGDGGTVVTDADADVNGASLAASIYAMAQAFDEKKVSAGDRNVFVKPAQYYLMAQNTDLINNDWAAGNGNLAAGTIQRIGGFMINKTNNVPTSNYAGADGENNTYNGTFNTTVAVAFNKSAVGTVQLMGLGVESEYSVRHQGTLIVAKYAVGHGILRPECAGEIKLS